MAENLEHRHQVALFQWAANMRSVYPELSLMYAIPNGGARNIITARGLKAEGVKAGVPDICLPIPRNGYGALYIELKSPNGTLQSNQREWIDSLNEAGNSAHVAKGWEAARDIIINYLKVE